MLTLSNSASRPAINLSTNGGNLTATIGTPYHDNTENVCHGNLCYTDGYPYCVCGGFTTEQHRERLIAAYATTTLGNDKSKDDDGQKDGPHHDIHRFNAFWCVDDNRCGQQGCPTCDPPKDEVSTVTATSTHSTL